MDSCLLTSTYVGINADCWLLPFGHLQSATRGYAGALRLERISGEFQALNDGTIIGPTIALYHAFDNTAPYRRAKALTLTGGTAVKTSGMDAKSTAAPTGFNFGGNNKAWHLDTKEWVQTLAAASGIYFGTFNHELNIAFYNGIIAHVDVTSAVTLRLNFHYRGVESGYEYAGAQGLFHDYAEQRIYTNATSGSFTLGYDGETTNPLAWNASALDIETQLELLTAITDVNVAGTGTQTDPWIITFVNPAAPKAQLLVTSIDLKRGISDPATIGVLDQNTYRYPTAVV